MSDPAKRWSLGPRPGRTRGDVGPAVLAFLAVGAPTAAIAVIAAWLGAAAVGALVSLLVIVTGLLFAKGPVPVEFERSLIRDALDRGESLPLKEVHRCARRHGLELGSAITLAGGIGLAIALAAL